MAMTTNPYRQPRTRSASLLKCRIWNATPQGKDDSTGSSQLYANDQFVWLGDSFSVPLAWIVRLSPVGPGFRIEWRDPATGQSDAATFCIRSFFGYDTKQRDRVLDRVHELSRHAASAGGSTAAAGASAPQCDVCGVPALEQADFREVRNFFLFFSSKTIRRVVCQSHARRATRETCLHNALLGTWGIPGIVTTPILAWSATSVLATPERVFWTALSATPAIGLAAALLLGR
jgi:hypothetical protein